MLSSDFWGRLIKMENMLGGWRMIIAMGGTQAWSSPCLSGPHP